MEANELVVVEHLHGVALVDDGELTEASPPVPQADLGGRAQPGAGVEAVILRRPVTPGAVVVDLVAACGGLGVGGSESLRSDILDVDRLAGLGQRGLRGLDLEASRLRGVPLGLGSLCPRPLHLLEGGARVDLGANGGVRHADQLLEG